MIRLMNSAMMPVEGFYTLQKISAESFGKQVAQAHRAGSLVSYIGYQQTADMIFAMSGVWVEMSRGQTQLNAGDELLICRLNYRVDPRKKGGPVKEDFLFFRCFYFEPDGAALKQFLSL